MVFVFDVDYNTFRGFKRIEATFFWSEEPDRFILVKVANNMTIRCVVVKDNSKADDMFKLRELFNYSGIFCRKISAPGEAKPGLVIQGTSTAGEVQLDDSFKRIELKKRRGK